MVRHSHEDAVNEQEFEELMGAVGDLKPRYQTETKFILVACGRLGMRAGEVAHLKESWVNWDRSLIKIPSQEPCDKGRNGGVCGYCRKQAKQHIERYPEKSLGEVVADYWSPKTSTSMRPIPFDFADWIGDVVEEFFWEYDRYEHSRLSINRRVNRVAEAAGLDKQRLYPHALRATAASWHAYRGLSAAALRALMGWRKLGVAQKYVRLSGEATARALRETHGDGIDTGVQFA